MFNQGNGYSLADIAAAVGGGNGMFGDGSNGAWWILLLFLFGFGGFGWGDGGFGGFGRPGGASA